MKTKPGTCGNAAGNNIVDRQWQASSYDPVTGRSHSSLADQTNRGSPSTTHAYGSNKSQTPPAGFYGRDAARTQISVPVRDRKFSSSR